MLGAFVVGGWVAGASVVAIVVATTVDGVAVVGAEVESEGLVVVATTVAARAGSVAGVDVSDDEQLTTSSPRMYTATIFLMNRPY